MADAKISALTAVTTPASTDEFPVNQGGTSKKMTLSQINAYTEPVSNSSTAAQGPGFAADTSLNGSVVTISPSRLQAGSFYRLKFDVSKTAAGVATAVVSIRLGTAGTTADTARLTLTFPSAQTAAIDTGRIEVDVNFRSVGSSTSAVVAGALHLWRTNTTTGFLSTSALAYTQIRATSAGFDSTTPTKIGASINGGASAAWTVTVVQADVLNLT